MPGNRYYAGPVTDHFDGTRFHTPGQPSPDRSLREVLRWKRANARARWPGSVPVVPTRPPARSGPPRLSMVGQATVLIQVAGLNILTDPIWSDRAGLFSRVGPKRVTAPGVDFDDLPPIDAVLISHNHYDHLDIATLRRLHARDHPVMVMPLGTDTTVRGALEDANIVVGDWHDSTTLAPGVSVHLTPAIHWSSRGPGDKRMALWCGFWIESAEARIWFAGDTCYGDGTVFRDIRARYGAPDIALIPIGAYEPRWFMGTQHVAPEDAVRICRDLDAGRAFGIHWGTFQLTDEPREEPPALLREAVAAAGLASSRFVALHPGDTYPEKDAAPSP